MSSAAADLKKLDEEQRQRNQVDDLYAKKYGGAEGATDAAGDEYMRKAAKKKEKWFGGDSRWDKAAELYEKAAAAYKSNENWSEAAGALCQSAEMQEKLKDKLSAANKYIEAAMCMARVDNADAIRLLEMGIAIHEGEARLGAAARAWKELAQLQEDEEQLQLAIDAWRRAADCHISEGTMANALQCLLHVAELHVSEYQFKKASKVYEQCAQICIDKQINKGSLRDYFYNALLCQFVVSARKGDLKNMRSMMARFLEIERRFAGTWQERLLRAAMKAFDDGDPQALAQAAADQDRIHKLDDRTTQIMLEVKRILQNPPQPDDADQMAEQLQ